MFGKFYYFFIVLSLALFPSCFPKPSINNPSLPSSAPMDSSLNAMTQANLTPVDPTTLTVQNLTIAQAILADEMVVDLKHSLTDQADYYQAMVCYVTSSCDDQKSVSYSNSEALIPWTKAGNIYAKVRACVSSQRSTVPNTQCGSWVQSNNMMMASDNNPSVRTILANSQNYFDNIRTDVLQMQQVAKNYVQEIGNSSQEPVDQMLDYFARTPSEKLVDIFSTDAVSAFPPITGNLQQSVGNIVQFLQQEQNAASQNPQTTPAVSSDNRPESAMLAAGLTGSAVLIAGVVMIFYGYNRYLFVSKKWGLSAPSVTSGKYPRYSMTFFGWANDTDTIFENFEVMNANKDFAQIKPGEQANTDLGPNGETRVMRAKFTDKPKRALHGNIQYSVRYYEQNEREHNAVKVVDGKFNWKTDGVMRIPILIEQPITNEKGEVTGFKDVEGEPDHLPNALKNQLRITIVEMKHKADTPVSLTYPEVEQAMRDANIDEVTFKRGQEYMKGKAPQFLGVGLDEEHIYFTTKAIRMHHHSGLVHGEPVAFAFMARDGITDGVFNGELQRYSGHYQPWYTKDYGTDMYTNANKILTNIQYKGKQFSLPDTPEKWRTQGIFETTTDIAVRKRLMNTGEMQRDPNPKAAMETEIGKWEIEKQSKIKEAKNFILGGVLTGAISPLIGIATYETVKYSGGTNLVDSTQALPPKQKQLAKVMQQILVLYQDILQQRAALADNLNQAFQMSAPIGN